MVISSLFLARQVAPVSPFFHIPLLSNVVQPRTDTPDRHGKLQCIRCLDVPCSNNNGFDPVQGFSFSFAEPPPVILVVLGVGQLVGGECPDNISFNPFSAFYFPGSPDTIQTPPGFRLCILRTCCKWRRLRILPNRRTGHSMDLFRRRQARKALPGMSGSRPRAVYQICCPHSKQDVHF